MSGSMLSTSTCLTGFLNSNSVFSTSRQIVRRNSTCDLVSLATNRSWLCSMNLPNCRIVAMSTKSVRCLKSNKNVNSSKRLDLAMLSRIVCKYCSLTSVYAKSISPVPVTTTHTCLSWPGKHSVLTVRLCD